MKPFAQSRLRVLKRDQLEKLVVELAEELRGHVWTQGPDEEHEREVATAEEASEQGYQALAMAMDPSHDYVGMEEAS